MGVSKDKYNKLELIRKYRSTKQKIKELEEDLQKLEKKEADLREKIEEIVKSNNE